MQPKTPRTTKQPSENRSQGKGGKQKQTKCTTHEDPRRDIETGGSLSQQIKPKHAQLRIMGHESHMIASENSSKAQTVLSSAGGGLAEKA